MIPSVRRELADSRNGAPTLLLDGRAVHSQYDPCREAQRIAHTIQAEPGSRVLVVLGEGLPYLTRALHTRHPDHRVLSIIAGPVEGLDTSELRQSFDALNTPPGSVRRWLRAHLHALDAGQVQLVTWEATRRVIPELVGRWEREAVEALQDLQSQVATVGTFGRRWLVNALHSTLRFDTRWEITAGPGRLVAATSGPGLELADLSSAPVAATSSALLALAARGVTPALVVHTDGGFWARRYLRHSPTVPVVLPLRSAVPFAATRGKTARPVMSSFDALEDQLAPDYSDWPRLVEHPTVTAVLLEFLKSLNTAFSLSLAGLDLASRGTLAHARPHANDYYLSVRTNRLRTDITLRTQRLLPALERLHWPDGTIAYRGYGHQAFLSPLEQLIDGLQHRGEVVAAGPSPGRRGRENPMPPPSVGDAVFHARPVARPGRGARLRHLTHTLMKWRDFIDEAHPGLPGSHQDLLLHLAPVETLQARRDAATVETARSAARKTVTYLTQLAEHCYGD
mgnify:CR=1 FL=1